MISNSDYLCVRYARTEKGTFHLIEDLFNNTTKIGLPQVIQFSKPQSDDYKQWFDQVCEDIEGNVVSGLKETDHRRVFAGDKPLDNGKRQLVFIFNENAQEVEVRFYQNRKPSKRFVQSLIKVA